MWFLYFYGTSTVISFIVMSILGLSLQAKIKRKFPNYRSKKTFWERIAYDLILLIPFLNAFVAIFSTFMQEKIYEKALKSIAEEMESDG